MFWLWQKIKSAAQWLVRKMTAGLRWLGTKLGIVTAAPAYQNQNHTQRVLVADAPSPHYALYVIDTLPLSSPPQDCPAHAVVLCPVRISNSSSSSTQRYDAYFVKEGQWVKRKEDLKKIHLGICPLFPLGIQPINKENEKIINRALADFLYYSKLPDNIKGKIASYWDQKELNRFNVARGRFFSLDYLALFQQKSVTYSEGRTKLLSAPIPQQMPHNLTF